MPFPDLPPERIPGSPGHLNDHQIIDQALDYIQQAGYRDDPDFPPLPDVPVLGQSGHVTAHDRILTVLEYVKDHPALGGPAAIANTPTGTYTANGHTYSYWLFPSNSTLQVTGAGLADVCLVGGGGGGGGAGPADHSHGGGGAGGQVVTVLGGYLPQGSLDVVVGAGGTGITSSNDYPSKTSFGGVSRLLGWEAAGGGYGGTYRQAAQTGGNAGGGGTHDPQQTSAYGTPTGGNRGGKGTAWGSPTSSGGGGGGAGGLGGNGVGGDGGDGGDGITETLTGKAYTFGRGGGGGGSASGGSPHGGAGEASGAPGSEYGGGGGGAAHKGTADVSRPGGDGYHGVVIVRIKTN